VKGDRGVATVFALAMAALLCGGGVVGLVVAESTVRHTRLGHIADTAALAAAASGCPLAGRLAQASGATLDSCDFDGLDAVVSVSCPDGGLLSRLAMLSDQTPPRFSASARAGP
jgi:secretion/DNA translocation related TadE-like protein